MNKQSMRDWHQMQFVPKQKNKIGGLLQAGTDAPHVRFLALGTANGFHCFIRESHLVPTSNAY